MPYCDILRKPYFNVPPEDPRVDLLLKQASRPVRVRAFSYAAKDGRAFVSPYVYFVTILIYGDDAEKDAEARARNAVLAACGSAFSLFAGRAGDKLPRINVLIRGGGVAARIGPLPTGQTSANVVPLLGETQQDIDSREFLLAAAPPGAPPGPAAPRRAPHFASVSQSFPAVSAR